MTPECVSSNTTEVRRRLRAEGWCVVDIGRTDRDALLRLAAELGLGPPQHHLRGDRNGITEVTAAATTEKTAIDRQQYLDLGRGSHAPHTDGTMLDGAAVTGRQLTRVCPPAYVCMQMVRTARSGGESLIVDGRPLLEDLVTGEPELLRQLIRPCVLFCRDEETAGLGPILRRIPGRSQWSIRWRFDHATYMLESAEDLLRRFQHGYIENPKYRRRFRLKPGQVLVTDNLRVLHGREAYQDDPARPRLLHRLWIADQTVRLVSPAAMPPDSRALRRHGYYRPEAAHGLRHRRDAADNGIWLARETEHYVQRVLTASMLS